TKKPVIERDLALIKVAVSVESRTHVMQLVDVYRARVVDVSADSLVVETTGTEDKIESLIEVLRPFGIAEIVRTGLIAMVSGAGSAAPPARRNGHSMAGQTADASSGSL